MRSRSNSARYFDALASTYGEGEYYAHRRRAVLTALSAELEAASAVLDLGCGNGAYLAEFVRLRSARRVIGVDLSFGMLSAARARLGPAVPLVSADAAALPFSAGSFDFVFASHVLPFVGPLDSPVKAIVDLVKDGGVIVATAGSGGLGGELRRMMPEARWQEFASAVFGAARLECSGRAEEPRYRAAFERAGLGVVERRVAFDVSWPGIEEWVRLRWMPVASSFDRARAEEFFAGVRGRKIRDSFHLSELLLVSRKPSGLTSRRPT